MRRIFISHRNGKPEDLALAQRLQASLADAGFDVLVDFDRLDPGAALREDIYTWLGICHAAIVVLSKSALADDSAWVPTESSILAWRKTLDPTFTLIPVLMPGVAVDDLRVHLRFRDLGLHDLVCVVHTGDASTCEKIGDALAPMAAASRTPLEDLAEQIEAMLDKVRPDFLDEAIRLTGADPRRLPRGMAQARSTALAMLQAPLAGTVDALEYLAPRLPAASDVDRILDIVAPSWVDLNAARWIAHCAAMPAPRPAAVVNVQTEFGAEMYVRRACSRPPRTMWRLVKVISVFGETVFDDMAVEIQEALEAEFASMLLADPFADAPEQQLARILAELNRRGRPVIVAMRLSSGFAELMPPLQDRFPHLTFLFLTGESLPEDDCPITLVRHLDPVLAAGRERAALTEWQTARTLLRSNP